MRLRILKLVTFVCWLAAWLPADPAAAGDRLLVTAAGERVAAKLVSATAEGEYAFDVAGEQRVLSTRDLVAWGAPDESGRGVQIVLADGGLLVAAEAFLDGESLSAECWLLAPADGSTHRLSLPLDRVAGALVTVPPDASQRDRLLVAVRSTEAKADRVFLVNGDELSGTLVKLTRQLVEFESDVGPVEIELDKVAAVAFDPTLWSGADPGPASSMIGLSDGTRLRVASLTWSETSATLALPGGDAWKFAPRDPERNDSDNLVWLRPLRDEVVYLSDLAPSSYKHVPFLDLAWPYKLDQSVAGGLLRVDGKLYPKGVGMHSTARLTWDLDGPWRRFEAEIALDDTSAGRGSVVFRVFADGKEAFASPVVRGGEAPLAIAADIAGAKRISLVVDFADRGDELDHADWLDARLVR